MEYTFLASYIAMLVGFLIKDNPEYEDNVRHFLKEKSFKVMVEILKKFFSFMNLTASVSFIFYYYLKNKNIFILFFLFKDGGLNMSN